MEDRNDITSTSTSELRLPHDLGVRSQQKAMTVDMNELLPNLHTSFRSRVQSVEQVGLRGTPQASLSTVRCMTAVSIVDGETHMKVLPKQLLASLLFIPVCCSQDNVYLKRDLKFEDFKPRLLGELGHLSGIDADLLSPGLSRQEA